MGDPFQLSFITDPLVTTAGAVRPAILLSNELSKYGYKITIFTPRLSEELQNLLTSSDLKSVEIGPLKSFINSMPTFDAWIRHIISNNKHPKLTKFDYVINTSSTSLIDSDVYYAQGPMVEAIKDMVPELPNYIKYGFYFFSNFLSYFEKKTLKNYESHSKYFIANSNYCAQMYQKLGIHTDDVIYPPLDTSLFRPSCQEPNMDYVLTYFGTLGKETNIQTINKIADAGIKVIGFGETPTDRRLLENRNVEFLGRISDKHLIELYSNALFTLFAFKHEPFGYVPVESMACGTPVLTYNMQGPSETVIDKKTGWLMDSDFNLVKMAKYLWEKGIHRGMRKDCVETIKKYDVKKIARKWIRYIGS